MQSARNQIGVFNGNEHGSVDSVLSSKSDIAYTWVKGMVNTSYWCSIFRFMTF